MKYLIVLLAVLASGAATAKDCKGSLEGFRDIVDSPIRINQETTAKMYAEVVRVCSRELAQRNAPSQSDGGGMSCVYLGGGITDCQPH